MTAVNRTITAPEVVIPEEPPAGSVVIGSDGHSWTRGGKWWNRGDTMSYASWDALMRGHAPLTVVWEPDTQPDQDRHDDARARERAIVEADMAVVQARKNVELTTRELHHRRNVLRLAVERYRGLTS